MKIWRKFIVPCFIAITWSVPSMSNTSHDASDIRFSFLGNEYSIKTQGMPGGFPSSQNNANNFTTTFRILDTYSADIISELSKIRKGLNLSDWYYYQLIRKVSQEFIPKEKDYWGYTYCKWFFLSKTGFRPVLFTIDNKLLLYVKSNSNIYNIPIKMINGEQYVCMNYHDYNYDVPIEKKTSQIIPTSFIENGADFDYMISQTPNFPEEKYVNRHLAFKYKGGLEKYEIKVCPEIKDYFTNYPVTDYRFQFNIPFSKPTYASLIPFLKKSLREKSTEEGVEYIMFLVRNAFDYGPDSSIYGREKRFSPEETLASDWSDCEDHAALFFALVREVYDLPMVVISYQDHINVGVNLKTPKGKPVIHNGSRYTICEPTPQKKSLQMGQLEKKLRKQPLEVVYEYIPTKS